MNGMVERSLSGISLFSGVGGLDIGVKLALPTATTVCYSEGETYAASILSKRMEEGRLDIGPIWSNVVTFDGKPWRGKVDFIVAGFPCQPWSKAGKLKKTEDERWLWADIERIISEVSPWFVLLENVSGLLNGGIDHVSGSLASLGFDCEFSTLRASDVGANHHRDRIFIVACRPERWGALADCLRNRRIDGSGSDSCEREHCEGGMAGCQSSSCGRDIPDANSKGSCDRGIISNLQEKGHFRDNVSTRSHFNESQFQPSSEKSQPSIDDDNVRPITEFRPEWEGCRDFKWWTVEPSVLRVANGVADRVDRIRACGNGVVPLQAATAFRELIKRGDR